MSDKWKERADDFEDAFQTACERVVLDILCDHRRERADKNEAVIEIFAERLRNLPHGKAR